MNFLLLQTDSALPRRRYAVLLKSNFWTKGACGAGNHRVCGFTFRRMFELALFQDDRGSEQNSNQAKYDQCEQSHQ
jgi:hypothetical protein